MRANTRRLKTALHSPQPLPLLTDHSALATRKMKTLTILLALALPRSPPNKTASSSSREKNRKARPLFFSAATFVTATAGISKTSTIQDITYIIHQGIPETLTLPISSRIIDSLVGENLRDWSVG